MLWLVIVIPLALVFCADIYVRVAALRAAPHDGRRFTCADVNRRPGCRVLTLRDDGYAVYWRGDCDSQIAYRDILSVTVKRSEGLVIKRNLIGLAVQARDGRTGFYIINGYVARFGHARRARQVAAVISEHLASPNVVR